MFRVVALIVVLGLVVAGASIVQPNESFLVRQWLSTCLEPVLAEYAAAMPDAPGRSVQLVMAQEQEERSAMIRQAVRLPPGLTWATPGAEPADTDLKLYVAVEASPHSVTVGYQLADAPPAVRRVGWYAVLPPLLAIVFAIATRHVVLSLSAGIAAGGMLAVGGVGGSPLTGLGHAAHHYLWQHALGSTFRVEVVAFVLLISATVGIAQRSGGIQAVIDRLSKFCSDRRSAQLAAATAGLLIFFDDYLNCIIVGNTMRPLIDRFRVSRAKLAFIVDSTAAPIAGLAVVSTWIIFELTQIAEGLRSAQVTAEPLAVFFQSLPYRFYCLFTLLLVFTIAWTGRDYGPMWAAERQAACFGPPADESASEAAIDPRPGRAGARHAVLPIGLTLAGIVVGLWYSGRPGPQDPPLTGDLLEQIQQVLGRANTPRVFAAASAGGYLLAIVMACGGGALSIREAWLASFRSVRLIAMAIVVLILAWSMGAACRDVGTAVYLVAMFREALHPAGFAVIVFLTACLIAFATGTSFGTMAILLPNITPLAMAVGETSPWGGMGLLIMSVGAVLEGSIFGDHCSPISDTTILSSIATRCDPIEHVRTQLPYALTAMVVALAGGYVPVALGAGPGVALLCGAALTVLAVRMLGSPLPENATQTTDIPDTGGR